MAGVYVHIPFCKRRCLYCDFYSTTLLERREAYVAALLREIAQRRGELRTPVRTIYFGGGTPSQLPVADIERLLAAIGMGDAKEITVEINPGDANLGYLTALRRIGVNRLSIGVQSFHDDLLQRLGRRHDGEQAMQAIDWAKEAGFRNISIDLMYAIPGQTMEHWQADVQTALLMSVHHISTYGLIYEPGTVLTRMVESGELTAVDEDTENAMYDYLCERLKRAGYDHYEVSNFALPGHYSRHNWSYWNDLQYLGIGAAAHSYDGMHRSWNVSDIEQYIRGAERETETLTDEDRYNERVMLGLRTSDGISRDILYDQQAAEQLIRRGLLKEEEGRLIATQQGLHILNSIIETLMI